MNIYPNLCLTRKMHLCSYFFLAAAIALAILGCNVRTAQQASDSKIAGDDDTAGNDVKRTSLSETKFETPNVFGYAKVSNRDGDLYREGVVDIQRNEVIETCSSMLVIAITDKVALVEFERKFLFVPLDQGFVSSKDLESVDGFQYAEPFQCGLALVSVNDNRFYIDSTFNRVFDGSFEFAESFHHDRALVRVEGKYRIIDKLGKTVADLNYDQVNPQSPWCWQVTTIDQERYLSGFVDLNGKMIAEMIYDEVGYYDPNVKRIAVTQNKRHGFLDEHAKVVIPVKYEYSEVFDRGKARVILDGRSFYINPEGVEVPE